MFGLQHSFDAQFGGAALAEALARRRVAVMAAATEINSLANRRELGDPPSAFYGSYVHMHCNRLASESYLLERRALGLLLRTR